MASSVLHAEGTTVMLGIARRYAELLVALAGGSSPAPDDVEARLLGQRRSLHSREVSAKASVSLESARKFWNALGFPHVEEEDRVFTKADVLALKSMTALVADGVFDEPTALAMTRAVSRTTDRLATWQVQLMAEAIGELSLTAGTSGSSEGQQVDAGLVRTAAMPDLATSRAAAVKLAEIADDLEPLLIYAWRRHLSAAISRMVTDAEPLLNQSGVTRSVGFADLVSFTSLVSRLSERELARLVQHFEVLASDVVTSHGGRVIKTVGDEVLFVARGAAPAAAIALDLVEAMAQDDVLPDVRVGVASGPVILRMGDVFGTTVNRASRLTAVARPGTVLVDDAVAASLASASGFKMSPMWRRTLRGIGPVTPWTLTRADLVGDRGMMVDDGREGDPDDAGHAGHPDHVAHADHADEGDHADEVTRVNRARGPES